MAYDGFGYLSKVLFDCKKKVRVKMLPYDEITMQINTNFLGSEKNLHEEKSKIKCVLNVNHIDQTGSCDSCLATVQNCPV